MNKLIDFEEVKARTGNMSGPTYWRLRKAKKFPDPIPISANRVAWLEADIEAWIAGRASAST